MQSYHFDYFFYMINIKIAIYTSQIVTIIKQHGSCYTPIYIKCKYQECGLYNTCLKPRKEMPSTHTIYKEAITEFKKYYSDEILFDEML